MPAACQEKGWTTSDQPLRSYLLYVSKVFIAYSRADQSNSPFSQPPPPWCSTDAHREAFARSDCSFQQRGKQLTELQLPTGNQGVSPFINLVRVQTTLVAQFLHGSALRPTPPLPSCQPPALKHSPEPTGAAALQPGDRSSPRLSTRQGILWQKTALLLPPSPLP